MVLSLVDSSIYPKLGFLHTYTKYLYINNPKCINISACGRMHNPPNYRNPVSTHFFRFSVKTSLGLLGAQIVELCQPSCKKTQPHFLSPHWLRDNFPLGVWGTHFTVRWKYSKSTSCFSSRKATSAGELANWLQPKLSLFVSKCLKWQVFVCSCNMIGFWNDTITSISNL